jgi:hypothetical protein
MVRPVQPGVSGPADAALGGVWAHPAGNAAAKTTTIDQVKRRI